MVAQIDNNVSRKQNEESVKLTQASVTIASTAKADSSAMKALAVLSTFFLPGTFISVCSTQANECSAAQLSTYTGPVLDEHV